MTALIKWLVARFLPGWHLVSPEEGGSLTLHWHPSQDIPNQPGYHIRRQSVVRNPVRKPKPVPVFEDGELTWKEEENV
jgi:hypothetical protein